MSAPHSGIRIDSYSPKQLDFYSPSGFVLYNVFGSRVLITAVRTGKRVRIPRCRATVSEDMQSATGKLGRLIVVSGRKVLTRKPGDRREP